MEQVLNYTELPKVLGKNESCQGCGSILALKLLLQAAGNCILVNATGSITKTVQNNETPFNVPFIHLGSNAAAVASGLRGMSVPVIAYAGDGATSQSLHSLLTAEERGDNFFYVCYNDAGYSTLGKRLDRNFAMLMRNAKYSATSSVAYPEDIIEKAKKALTLTGFKYLEILAPCPKSWGYDPSNTMEIARRATETGFWPVFEFENKKVHMTKRQNRLEPVENLLMMFSNSIYYNKEELQEKINKNWKVLNEGKL